MKKFSLPLPPPGCTPSSAVSAAELERVRPANNEQTPWRGRGKTISQEILATDLPQRGPTAGFYPPSAANSVRNVVASKLFSFNRREGERRQRGKLTGKISIRDTGGKRRGKKAREMRLKPNSRKFDTSIPSKASLSSRRDVNLPPPRGSN